MENIINLYWPWVINVVTLSIGLAITIRILLTGLAKIQGFQNDAPQS